MPIFNVVGLCGGYGSGKTALATHILQRYCETPDRYVLAIGRSRAALQATLVDTIDTEIPKPLIEDFKQGDYFEWTIKSRVKGRPSKIVTRTVQYGHEANKLRSMNAHCLYLQEATMLPHHVFDIGISRLRRHTDSPHYLTLFDTNPDSQGNWVWKYFLEHSTETTRAANGYFWTTQNKSQHEIECEPVTIRNFIAHTTTFANRFFPKSQIALLREKLSESEFQRMVMGIWNAGEGRVWDTPETFKHPAGSMVEFARQFDEIFLGLDPGDEHPAAITFIGSKGGCYYIFDEIVERRRSVIAMYGELVERLNQWGITRHLDLWNEPSGLGKAWQRIINEIPDRRVTSYESSRKGHGTEPSVYQWKRLDELIRNKRLLVSEKCTCVIQDCEQTVKKEGDLKERIDKERYDPHAMDSVGHALVMKI